GKEQSIIIKASSGLSDEEVERMVQDAEAHADEDRKITELVTARNSAEGMINATEKSVEELGDKVDTTEKEAIDAAVKALQEAIKGDDKDDIEAKTTALTELSGKLAEKVYAEQAAAGADVKGAPEGEPATNKADDDALDAEFEEVKKD
ncbi:MAG: Hsp70 family protein, partial [Methylococcales bacterium]|nr:Hsp70 family protein [Methylococcales bacterium]